MSDKQDPRHLKRVKIVQTLFAASFNSDQEIGEESKPVWDAKGQIDPLIEKTAPEWPLEKLNKIDLSILRLSIYELLIDKREPIKVIVDEAVELAKELGGENSPSFVNGVLGTIITEHGLEKSKEEKEKNE